MKDFDVHAALLRQRPMHLPYRKAAGIVLADPHKRILMGRRRNSRDLWKMPSGGIEDGEWIEHAALRELREETGFINVLIIREAKKAYTIERPVQQRGMQKYRGQTTHWLLGETINMSDELLEKATRVRPESPEFDALRWVAPEDILLLTHNDANGDAVSFQTQKMYRAVLAEFGFLKMSEPVLGTHGLPQNTSQTFMPR